LERTIESRKIGEKIGVLSEGSLPSAAEWSRCRTFRGKNLGGGAEKKAAIAPRGRGKKLSVPKMERKSSRKHIAQKTKKKRGK